jgi:4'-phosphopantetheinyl transferase
MILIERGNMNIGLLNKADVDSETWMSEIELQRFNGFHFENRKQEFIGVRQIRNKLCPKESIINEPNGKPKFLSSPLHVSVSHSKKSICLGIGKNPIGIDLEVINPRILRVKDKFVNQAEIDFYPIESLEDLTILWTIKESVYKLCNIGGLSFKNDIIAFHRNKNEHKCMIRTSEGEKEFTLLHEKFDNEILTYNCT